jgi:hypothetical protein
MDSKFHHVKVADDEATIQASTIGLGKFVKKFNVLSIEEERKILT